MSRGLRGLGAASAALAVLLLLHLVPIGGVTTELSRGLLSALHAPAFATLALLLRALAAGHLVSPRGRRRPWVTPLALDGIALAAAAAAGAAFELAQVLGPRRAELFDLAADVCGAVGGLLLRAAIRARRDGRVRLAGRVPRIALALAGIAALAAPAVPAAFRLAETRRRDAAVPLLGAFEERWELAFWEARGGTLAIVPPLPGWPAARGRGVGCARLWRRDWPGLVLGEPPPDWSRFRRLAFEAFHAGERPLVLHLRIHDERHDDRYEDRFNLSLELPPGPSRHAIDLAAVRAAPRGREMDMSRIAGLALFIERPESSVTLCFDEVRLEGTPRQSSPAPEASASIRSRDRRNTVQSSMLSAPSPR